ncbi:MAG: type II/IV secretion system protein [Planctomycetota bacterium]|nr:MAG: type II/IV secretion system protein [Planctomycetota bacterium]
MPLIEPRLADVLSGADPNSPNDVGEVLLRLLRFAQQQGATDLHFRPQPDGLLVSWRRDGVAQPLARFSAEVAANYVGRLKVMSGLLTYRVEIPQEGRLRAEFLQDGVEVRVATFPTIHGERAVVRLFVASGRYLHLEDLGLPQDEREALQNMLWETGGLVLISGPAGSGKTTTAYACLRYLLRHFAEEKILLTLEDPVEAVLPSVGQSEVRPSAGFDYVTGLKSLLRHDPDVLMVGEIRDRGTAEIVFQAALTGHLVVSTFHAGSVGESVSRLLDLGIEPFVLQSGLLGVLSQRLVRRLCPDCRRPAEQDALGLPVAGHFVAAGCAACRQTGYRDRVLLIELLDTNLPGFDRHVLTRADARAIESAAAAAGMTTRWDRAVELVESGVTSAVEIRRVLGFR